MTEPIKAGDVVEFIHEQDALEVGAECVTVDRVNGPTLYFKHNGNQHGIRAEFVRKVSP